MLREILFAKIHGATVTRCNPEYHGSITIDPALLEVTGIVPNEKVLIADCDNGDRFETYVFEGERGSGLIEINGAAASRTAVGHKVLIMAYCMVNAEEMASFAPKVVICDESNGISELLRYDPAPANVI